MGDFGMGQLLTGFLCLLVIAPLGIWKLVEVVIWLCHHLHWSVS